MIDILVATLIFSGIVTLLLILESLVFMATNSSDMYEFNKGRILFFWVIIWVGSIVGYYFVEYSSALL